MKKTINIFILIFLAIIILLFLLYPPYSHKPDFTCDIDGFSGEKKQFQLTYNKLYGDVIFEDQNNSNNKIKLLVPDYYGELSVVDYKWQNQNELRIEINKNEALLINLPYSIKFEYHNLVRK